ncbi:YaeQ family protein [Eoetvoesiella caeni]|uniref:Uncharacterized protein YaeQ n=1 Tax=Eoetvoesiella caeni TaxID=645616 RepID=A0A366HJF6_9BURK|nr:YaeQ family protein [Eoetvoesiella caeni]MCI2807502.1 YaeQ family protein [Eoetvoesiella caeni]NYT53103.1 YaeQ family protein [Eoetvoesiella caeni]RBP43080.1 uncharacterized protein YaeQ [Eoetvoesiella caeni]
MALRATIFKLELHIADMVRAYYDSHTLTLARHPSETDERMMMRVLAFSLLADEHMVFTRGLSTTEEPALWRKDLTGSILTWVELGHPDERRILQASGKSQEVVVFCYGGPASQVWWQGVSKGLERVRNLKVYAVQPAAARELAGLAQRNMALHASIEEGMAMLSSDTGSAVVEIEAWR